MSQWLRIVAARIWGALPNEHLKTTLLAHLGPRFLVSVWAIVLDDNGRVLLFRHTHDLTHPWGLPSGRLEAHETPEEAIRREFCEEVGGQLHARRLVAALREPDLPALRLAYRCELEAPPIMASPEVVEWKFFALDDLPRSTRPLQRRAIAAALADPQTSTNSWR